VVLYWLGLQRHELLLGQNLWITLIVVFWLVTGIVGFVLACAIRPSVKAISG
jgi:hypothetical protein